MFLFQNRFMMILLEKIVDGTQNGIPDSFFWLKIKKSHFLKMENELNLRVYRIPSKHHLQAVDTVLETSNIILFEKNLWVTLWVPLHMISSPKNRILAILSNFS